MIHKRHSTRPGCICVTFELPDSLWANQVYLTGDLADTPLSKVPMRQDRDGAWRLTLDLPIGTQYKYRYQIDQCWYTEWSAKVATSYGLDPQYSILDLESS